ALPRRRAVRRHAGARRRRSRDARPLGRGRGAPAHRAHARDRRRASVRARGGPRRLPAPRRRPRGGLRADARGFPRCPSGRGGEGVGAGGGPAVCSFYATKLLTTGEGGAVAGPAALVARARDARDYDERAEQAPRFNYKMTDMQAALGRGQLARLDAFIARRRALAERYWAALAR